MPIVPGAGANGIKSRACLVVSEEHGQILGKKIQCGSGLLTSPFQDITRVLGAPDVGAVL